MKLQKKFYDLLSLQCLQRCSCYSETGFKFNLPLSGQTRKGSKPRTNPSQAIAPKGGFGEKSSAADEALKGAFVVKDYHILTHISYQLARIVKEYPSNAIR